MIVLSRKEIPAGGLLRSCCMAPSQARFEYFSSSDLRNSWMLISPPGSSPRAIFSAARQRSAPVSVLMTFLVRASDSHATNDAPGNALVNMSDLLNLLVAALGETNPPILVGEGEDDFDIPENYGGTE